MRKHSHGSVALFAGAALGLAAIACSAQASEPSAQEQSPAQAAPATGQQRIADATRKLESAFSEQFVQGKIDRSALAAPINEVVQAMPEGARPKVQEHIAQILTDGEKLASQLTPEQRAQAAAPATKEQVGTTQQAQIGGWGWGDGLGGFGGYGAFGFPGMYGGWGGLGYGGLGGLGYGGFGGLGGLGFGGFGGLGLGGWFW